MKFLMEINVVNLYVQVYFDINFFKFKQNNNDE